MNFVKVEGRNIPVFKLNTIVVGSGCAGFNAIDTLYDLGVQDIAMVTEGIHMGTSRNTGSDKQTYYKMSVESGQSDSADKMAASLFGGKSVNGDTALIESAASLRSFMKLVTLGVPFPTNEYGEFVGYRTDHDNGKRATSAGPLTSKYMTEALERQVLKKGIKIFDNTIIVQLIVENNIVKGAIGLNKKQLYNENNGFVLFLADNIILATGGPAAVYQNSVYPCSQSGMTGLAIEAGAVCVNLQEWQYGMASVDFRWNLSGTYQQVIPKYISVDENGVEREFLPDYFENEIDAANYVFMKGYQWPFDSAKLSGSSVIDLIVYHEEVELGRKVYMDFRSEPSVLENGFDSLSEEAFSYLKNSDALIKTPIKRLEKMNPKAIELYKSHGIDLYTEPLRITVAAQHNNGGVGVDKNWETNISGLYVAGEAAGTFGVYRPGGSALNSTQVGSLRAAESICYSKKEHTEISDNALKHSCGKIAYLLSAVEKNCDKKVLNPQIHLLRRNFARFMSECGAHMRNSEGLKELGEKIALQLSQLDALAQDICPADLPGWFKLRDLLLTQQAIVSSILYAGSFIGNRGGSVYCSTTPDLTSAAKIQAIDVTENEGFADKLLCYSADNGCSFKPVRPIPQCENWFEKVWNDYNARCGK